MKGYKLLLVDDNSRSLKLLEAIYQGEGYATITASDGQVAMEILVAQHIDLVITDILMPNVDGYYLCYKIRNHERLMNIPIIIYTATYTSVSEEKVAKEMGADFFIQKPAPIQILLSAAKDLLKNPRKSTDHAFHSAGSFEVMHQYSSDLVNKLEQRNIALEEIRHHLEDTVHERTSQLQNVNQELLASNEELSAANEELHAINEKLVEATKLIQQQSEIIIQQKDEQLNRVLDSSSHIIWSLDLTGNGQDYMSRSIEKMVGETSESFLKKKESWGNWVYPEDQKIWDNAKQQLKELGHAQATCRVIDWKGQLHWMHLQYRIIKDKNGVPLRQEGISSDISPIIEAEKSLQNERKLLRSLIDNIPDYIYVKDLNLKHILNNRSNLGLLGTESEKETLGKTVVDYFGPEAETYLADDRRVIATGDNLINKEEILRDPARGTRILLTTKVPLRDDSDKIIGVIGISRDITEHRKQEQILNQYQENLDIIFSSTQEEILLLDREGKVVLFNNALGAFLQKVTGKKPRVGQYLWDITVADRREIAKETFNRAVKGELIYTEAPIVTTEGTLVHELRYEPILINGIVKYVSLISLDITQRKKNERELKQSRHLLSKAYEVARIGYWSYDTGINRSEWDEQAKWIFGLPENFHATFEGYLAIVHPDDREKVAQAATLTIRESKSYDIEHRIIRPSDGQMRWVHERADFTSGENNSRLLIGVVQDITERKTIEEALMEYNERYEILSKATNDAIWDWDIEHDFEIWNHGIQTIFGYSDQQIGTTKDWWREKIHREDYERVLLEIKSAFGQQKTNWTSQYRFLCADGSYKYVLDRAYITYRDDKPVRVIGAMQDITEQKEFESNITAIARELSDLIENANTPIFGTDRNGYVNEWNKVTAQLTGYSKNETMGKKLTEFIHEDQRYDFNLILEQVTTDNPISNLQIPMIAKDKRDLIILLNATPRKNSLQHLEGVLMVGQDITELIEYRMNLEAKVQERTRELNEALHKEKELVEMKSKFVSIASHEFRTPLSTISLVSGFLKKHRDKITKDEFNTKLETVEKQVSHMTYLLDDILMIGKSDAGKIKTQYTAINIENFFRQTAREVRESTKTHQINLQIKCSVKEFSTDEKLIRNIVINLLTNAIKFSPHAQSISLRISNSPDHLKIETEDKGIGIANEDLNNLFTAFHRGGNVGTIQGTGLGLSIVKKAVDLLHGNIQIKSQADHGTLFTVTLPLRE